MWGVLTLLIALAAAGAFALYRRRVDGRFRSSRPEPSQAAAGGGDPAPQDADRLTDADLGTRLGPNATVVQFSSQFCAPCRAAERVITEAVADRRGVQYVDLDSESNLDLVRRFNILRTPTVLVVDAAGRVVARSAGVPTKQNLLSVLPLGVQP